MGDLSGRIGLIVLVAVPVALILSIFLQWLYLRSVRRSMMHAAGATIVDAELSPPAGMLRALDFATEQWSWNLPASQANKARRRAALIYLAGAITYGFVLTLFFVSGLDEGGLIRFRTPLLTGMIAFPIVLTLAVAIMVSWRELWGAIFAYAVFMVLIYVPQLAKGNTWDDFNKMFFLFNVPPLILAMIFLLPRVRTIGPLVLILTLAAASGAFLSNHLLFQDNPERLRTFVEIGGKLGLGGVGLFYSIMALGAIVVGGLVGWTIMRLVGALYRRGLLSDQSLLVDSIWLIFSIAHAASMYHRGPLYFLAPFIAFAAARLVTTTGFWLLRRRETAQTYAPNLLLLRVFSLGRRSSRLFNKVSRLWRYRGTIHMIAGPDLVSTTVEPHEFLDFLSGRLSRRFISDKRSFERRLAEVEPRRDLDGRYRVGDFFCNDNAWQMALTRLAQHADVIMMDLRGFTPKHQGCVFEIREIVNRVGFARVVFVIDGTTDEAFLRQTFAAAWENVPASSPNVADPRSVTLFRLGDGQTSDVKALVALLESLSGRRSVPALRRDPALAPP